MSFESGKSQRKKKIGHLMLNATLSKSKANLNKAWGNMKKTMSSKSIFRQREGSVDDDDDYSLYHKFKEKVMPEGMKRKKTKHSPSESGLLDGVNHDDRIVDELSSRPEDRLKRIMKAQAKRREEVFEKTLEAYDNTDADSRVSRSSIPSIKSSISVEGSSGQHKKSTSTAHSPSVSLSKASSARSSLIKSSRLPNLSNISFTAMSRPIGLTIQRGLKNNKNHKSSSKRSETSRPFEKLDVPFVPKPEEDKTVIRDAMNKNMFFNGLTSDELDMIINAMEIKTVPDGEEIIKEGEKGDEFFVVKSGEFRILRAEENKQVSKLLVGDSFGEAALIHNSRRAVTAVATADSQVFSLSRLNYRKIVAFSEDNRLRQIRQALRSVPLLQSLEKDQISDIADCVQLVKFSKGDPIIVKGDVGDIFYIIKTGSVQCTKLGKKEELMDIRLGANDYFGERALLVNEPRAANVIALEAVECFALDRESFATYLGSLKDILNRTISLRALKAMPLLHELNDRQLSKLYDSFEEVTFLPGEQIIEQGSKNKKLYIITEGMVDVVLFDQTDRQKHTTLGQLKAGDYFGESALKPGVLATAEVTAVDHVTCQAVAVKKHLKSLRPIANTIRKKHTARQKDAIEAVKRNSKTIKKFEQTILLEDLEHVKTLGTGTFGRVKLVEHRRTGNTYALKILQKAFVIQYKQQRNVMNEKMVMMKSQHPFILKLHRTFTSKNCLYFLLEYVQGGELFSLLHLHGGRMRSSSAKFYAACVIDAIGYLHKRQIVYRDLKPENLMIDSTGYIRIVDFGFAKKVTSKTFTLCGTPEYLPPETIQSVGHNRAVDYWAIGVLIYEMISGFSPFSDPDRNSQDEIFERILRGKFMFPSGFSSDARQLVRKLIHKDPRERLGMFKEGPDEIKTQPWFANIDWKELLEKKKKAPWIPTIDGNTDTQHFEQFDEDDSEIPYKGSNKYWSNF